MVRLLALLLLVASSWVSAKEATSAAPDPALEQRVMALSNELRCLVCQNQTIADSSAPLAEDLRNQVREKMRQGASDSQIIDFMVERYGDFVLYRPPVKATTLLLWFGPLLLLLAGLLVLLRRLLRRRPAQDVEMTPAERSRVAELLAGKEAERR